LLEVDEAFMPRDHSDDEIITPDIEESPSLPSSLNWKRKIQEDTRMHGASWYEPEKDRIIITELTDSDSEPEDQSNAVQIMSSEATPYWDEEEKCFKPFKVSPAYLSRFGKIPQTENLPINEPNCMALVAYRPPPLPLPILGQVDEVEEMSSSDDQTQDGMVVDAMELDE
ncbi:6_t:CDS:2, partial [Acaulospora colombiana]